MATQKMMEIVSKPKTEAEMLVAMTAEALRLAQRLDNGRHYLMGINPSKFTVEDCFEAFGFTRNGIGDAE